MKHLLNTLYVTTPDAYVSKEGNNIVISRNSQRVFRVPIQNLDSINTFGYQGASPGAMHLCVENDVSLSFFTPSGRFIARIQGPVKGNILLRHQQYELFQEPIYALHLARLSVMAKISNSRVTLKRFIRDYPDHPGAVDTDDAAKTLKLCLEKARSSETLKNLRAIEGQAAAVYFNVFQYLILNRQKNFQFDKRCRRPPTDIINAMLSFGYSIMANDCASALEGVGLDSALGFMHTMRPGRKSLALDMMEEFRSYIVDRLVISAINNRQLVPEDFQCHTSTLSEISSSVRFTDKGLKKFLEIWQDRKRDEITHPFLKEKVSIGLLPHIQALLLARYIRGDMDDYPVFLTR